LHFKPAALTGFHSVSDWLDPFFPEEILDPAKNNRKENNRSRVRRKRGMFTSLARSTTQLHQPGAKIAFSHHAF